MSSRGPDHHRLSIPVSIGLAAVLYPAVLWLFPEPADAYGPAGPRFVRAAAPKNILIVDEKKDLEPVLS